MVKLYTLKMVTFLKFQPLQPHITPWGYRKGSDLYMCTTGLICSHGVGLWAYIKILFVSPFRLSIVTYGSVGRKNSLFFPPRIINISDNKVHFN
jgi:hypothetical protein